MNTGNPDLGAFQQRLEEAAPQLIEQASAIATAALCVAAVREPKKFGNCSELVRSGRMTLQISVGAGGLEIYLRDHATGSYVPVFSFAAPIAAKEE